MVSARISRAGVLAGLVSMLSVAQAELSYPAVQPEYDYWGKLDDDLRSNLPGMPIQLDVWPAGWVPGVCFWDDGWNAGGFDGADFDVFNITYPDCSEPFVLCRHRATQAQLGSIIQAIGKIPARMRQYVSNWVAIPTVRPQNSGWQIGSKITLQDTYWDSPGIVYHEVTHVMDLMLGGWNYWSDGGAWPAAIDADGVIASEYGRLNYIEAFAEVGRLWAYEKFVPGGLAQLPTPKSLLQNQFTQFNNILGDYYDLSKQCTGKVPSADPVPVSVAKFRGSSEKPGPKPSVKVTSVPEIVVPEAAQSLSANCTLNHSH